MTMYKYPKRKRYKYIIPTIKGDCVLQLEQATASETNDYIEILTMISSDNRETKVRGLELKAKYIRDLIFKAYPVKRYELKKRYKRNLVVKDLGNYIKDILELLHVTWESIYTGTNPPKVNGKKSRSARFDSLYDIIHKATGIPSDEIENRLTAEQIGWYTDKHIFSNYEQFKEGMAINDVVFSKQGLTREQQNDLELIKKHLHAKSK